MTLTESKSNKKKSNKGVPLPKARDKMYTVQENKLLDQITMELCEAWAKDLRKIRECFTKNKELSDELHAMYATLKPRMEDIECFLVKESKLDAINEIKQNQLALAQHFDTVRQDLFNLAPHTFRKKEDKIEIMGKKVDDLQQSMQKLMDALKLVDQNKWWLFWR